MRRRRPQVASACAPLPPAGCGRFFSRAGRKSKATDMHRAYHPVLVSYRYRDELGTPVRTDKSNLGVDNDEILTVTDCTRLKYWYHPIASGQCTALLADRYIPPVPGT
ncbi:hypothetical protein GW17_00000656 [Ensete ventricosum]|nr:hypothetical protein GW17_00000656 [Ensete ventricosum]RZS02519.1 hypothetical protein BHM03_00032572 [Ensete ventricosum]